MYCQYAGHSPSEVEDLNVTVKANGVNISWFPPRWPNGAVSYDVRVANGSFPEMSAFVSRENVTVSSMAMQQGQTQFCYNGADNTLRQSVADSLMYIHTRTYVLVMAKLLLFIIGNLITHGPFIYIIIILHFLCKVYKFTTRKDPSKLKPSHMCSLISKIKCKIKPNVISDFFSVIYLFIFIVGKVGVCIYTFSVGGVCFHRNI